MKLSFGMIFSIILIIVFLIFAFYAIKKVLSFQKSMTLGKFADSLRNDIDEAWLGPQISEEFSYNMPGGILAVCFVDFSQNPRGPKKDIYDKLNQAYYGSENLIFYPVGSAEGHDSLLVEHINMNKTLEKENPFCIDVEKGKISMTFKKEFNEDRIIVER